MPERETEDGTETETETGIRGGAPRELLPAWRELDGALRAYFARRVPAGDVDDLLQDCYLRVTEGLPSLVDQERVSGWIFRIAHNLVVDHLRRRSRELPEDALDDAGDGPAHPEDAGRPDPHRTVAGWLAAFVDRLPPRYAEVLRRSELDELTHREIAARLDLSVSAVKSRVARGRALLRDKLLACCTLEFDRRGRIVDHRRNAPRPCECEAPSSPEHGRRSSASGARRAEPEESRRG